MTYKYVKFKKLDIISDYEWIFFSSNKGLSSSLIL